MLLIPVLGFIFITLLVTAGAMALAPSGAGTLERRLEEVSDWQGRPHRRDGDRKGQSFLSGLKRLGSVAPQSAKEMGKLQKRLVNAGYRSSEALPIFFGIRVGLALLLFALCATPILMTPNFVLALGACGVGYVLPGMALGRMAKKRQHMIRLGLPDALDLMVVSVEAGLGLDQAIQRVADEMAYAHPAPRRRAAPHQPRAARRQGALRGAPQPGRADRRRRRRVAGGDARADRQVRHQRRAVAARAQRHAPDQAAPARRGGRREDRRQDGVPARVLHLPGGLGRHDRPGRHQVRPGRLSAVGAQ